MNKEKNKKREDVLFDKRLYTRFLRKNVISKKDYQDYLESLPDLEENLLKIQVLGDNLPSVKKIKKDPEDLDNPQSDD